MADVVKFPGAPSNRELNDDGDRPHAEAFRDLEPGICDCTTMAKIAADIALSANTADCAAYHGEKWRDAAPGSAGADRARNEQAARLTPRAVFCAYVRARH
jgi:hypothetical protein